MTPLTWLRNRRTPPKATGGYVSADTLIILEGCRMPALEPVELPAGTVIEMRYDPPNTERLRAALGRHFDSEHAWAAEHTDNDECVCCLGRYSTCHNAT